jgi:very-short-patch-repair endonuclease
MRQALSNNNFLYNKGLKLNAQALRKSMTKAEACLWKYVLQGQSLRGHQFRRQRPVLNFIADFMCKELNLIIEVDGITHTYENVAGKDSLRQKKLEEAGFTVLRFTDDEVLKDIARIKICLEDWIDNNFHPLPPPAGDIDSNEQLSKSGKILIK